MTTFDRAKQLAALAALGLCAAGCTMPIDAPDERVGQAESPVYVFPNATLFTQNNWQVPVCFKNPGLQGFKNRIRTALESTWQAYTWLAIGGFTDCLGTAPANSVPIELIENTAPNATGCSGRTFPGLGARLTGVDAQITITAATNNGCLELVAAHEMGHALGLNHEHQRPDRDATATACADLLVQMNPAYAGDVSVAPGGIFETTYDPDSVMNYCRDFNRNGSIDLLEVGTQRPYFLSALDRAGARLLYGNSVEDEDISAGFALTTQSSPTTNTAVNLADNHSWNSFGAVPNVFRRTGTGVYRVDFPRLGGPNPHIQVSAFNSSNRCKVDTFTSSGSTLQVTVRCHNTSGSASNTRFSISVVHSLGGFAASNASTTWRDGGFVLADQHTTSNQYNPSATYNSRGLTNTVKRTGTGAYDVTFPGLDFQEWPFSYELTAVGSGSEYCNIRGHRYNAAETDKIVDVRCFSSSGSPTNSKFYLKYAPSTHQTPSFATVFASQKSNQQPYLADFTRSMVDNICGRGPVYDPVTVARLGTGNYRVTLQPGQLITDSTNTPFGKSIANAVVLPAASSEYCYVDKYNTTTPPSVEVRCRTSSGSSVDAAFYLTFASLNASNCLN